MLKPNTLALTVLLAALTGLGPLTIDLYLPSLPSIARLFNRDPAIVQLTLSVYFIGFAAGQIFHGPMSDRFGRRPVLLWGLCGYLVASAICAMTQSVETMIAARALQGLAASGPIVLARSVARDLYDGPRAGRELARMGTIMGIVPGIAPAVGGVLELYFGWRSAFVAQVCLGAILTFVVWQRLPETLRERLTTPFSVRALLGDFASLLRDPGYRLHLGLQAVTFAGLFSFISGSSFVLQGYYHLSVIGFGLTFVFLSASIITGSILAQRLVGRIGMPAAIGYGTCLLVTGGLLALLGQIFSHGTPVELIIPVMFYITGVGIIMPLAQASALMPYPEMAGTASSLMGFVQMTFGALVGAIVGQGLSSGPWSLVISLATVSLAALFLHLRLNAWRARTG